jgi:hypothetical protein
MKFIEQYQQLKTLFDLNQDEMMIPGSTIRIKNMAFHSHAGGYSSSAGQIEDSHISENIRFRYPVLLPDGKLKADKAIVFLHGLNERTWHKHLASAKFLSEKTGQAVIMFPLSFHINRGLPEWSDVRKLTGLLEIRKKQYPGIQEASLANLALSERLTEYPQRFFISGLQSTMDLIYLLNEIQRGDHPLFEADSHIDLFAYSISCMLLQSLMISNPDGILSRSKIVFFAGGSLFGQMQGMSRYIMDSVAFDTIRKFYLDIVSKKTGFLKDIEPWMMEHSFGKAFRSLIVPDFLKKERVKSMADFHNQLMIIALRDDQVMPVEGIRQATGEKFFRSARFRTIHFPYSYTHENPFPVLYRKIDDQVEQAFLSVFNPAVKFLSGNAVL